MNKSQRLVKLLLILSLFLGSLLSLHAQVMENRTRTKVVLLGTGTPNADPDRSGPSLAVIVDTVSYLIDFGPGVVRRAAAAAQKGIEALKVNNIKHVFVTHLHSDHTAGYPDLILTPWVLEREAPLEIYGPKGLQLMTTHILEAYKIDIQTRINGLEPANPSGWKVNVHEIDPGLVYQDDKVKIKAFPVNHGSWTAFGYRFQTPDKTIVISGDTTPCNELIKNAQGCDILIHEVYSAVKFQKRESVWQTYHKAHHTSTTELAGIAEQVKPGLLILIHQLFWGATDEELVEEIKMLYSGKVVSGKDLEVF